MSCAKSAAPDKAYCSDHIQQFRKRERERINGLIAQGICTACRQSPVRPDRKTCGTCGAHAARQTKKYTRKKKRAGLCVFGACQSSPAPKQTLCDVHLRQLAERNSEMYSKRLAAGLCRNCGKRPRLFGDSAHCLDCRIINRGKFSLPSKIRKIIRQFWRLDRIDTRRALAESVLVYLPKERQVGILRMRHGLDDGIDHTLEEISEAFGVTRERIRQIEGKSYRIAEQHGVDVSELRKPSEIQRSPNPKQRNISKRKLVKERAGNLLRTAIREGKIQRRPCEKCGALKALAHHHDYSKPYDVIWLCPRHHAEAHGKKIHEPRTKRERGPQKEGKEYLIPCWLANASPSSGYYDAPAIVAALGELWLKRQQVSDITGLSNRTITKIINGQPVDDASLAVMLRYIEAAKKQRAA